MFEQIKKFVTENCIIVLSVILLFISVCFFRNLHDNSNGTEPIKQQLDRVKDNQQRVIDDLSGAEKRSERIEEGINRIENNVNDFESKVRESNRIIEQCESIIETVRKRNQS